MRRIAGLYGSSVGKKIAMAGTGAALLAFLVAHMLGNLKVFQGPAAFDTYAEHLRTLGEPVLARGQALWITRIALLAAVLVHVVAATQLTLQSRRARVAGYRRFDDQSMSYASRTMRWGGILLALFVVYHLLHLTTGTVHPSFDAASPFRNVVAGFRSPAVSAVYCVTMSILALHVYHGVWSATQTLGLSDPRVIRWRRPFAAALALAIGLGFVAVPAAVLGGVVR